MANSPGTSAPVPASRILRGSIWGGSAPGRLQICEASEVCYRFAYRLHSIPPRQHFSICFSHLRRMRRDDQYASVMPSTFPAIQGGGSLILAWQIKGKEVLVIGGGEVS